MAHRLAANPRRFIGSAMALVLLAAGILVGLIKGAQNAHAALPSGFSDTVVMSGLTHPTQVAFASDGSILDRAEEREDLLVQELRRHPARPSSPI